MASLSQQAWKFAIAFPLILFVFALIILASNQLSTGSFIGRDIELSGGKMIIFSADGDITQLSQQFPFANFKKSTGVTTSIIAEIPIEQDEKQFVTDVSAIIRVNGEPTVRRVEPALGNLFFTHALVSIGFALIAMSVVIFIMFRKLVPSIIIMSSVVLDVITTMGIMSVLGINLSLPVLAALLSIIAYSVDTDILLMTSLFKEGEHDLGKKVHTATITGLTMMSTSFVALLSLYFLTGSLVLEQIASVLIIGLVIDIFVTWCTNAGILRWYIERGKKQ